MPRTVRISSPDLAHHVMVRGIERRVVFHDEDDRRDLLRRLEHVFAGSRTRCYAWALMPNHFHLVLRVGNVPLSRLMARIGTGYARRFNERHERVGHLFQNRFRSRIVEDDADLIGLVRYVHLNPLVGGLVESLSALERYEWCGHAGLHGCAAASFHSVDETLALFGDEPGIARQQLREWMREGWRNGLEPDALELAELARGGGREQGVAAKDVRWDSLIESVESRFGLPDGLLCGGARVRSLAEPRAILAHMAVQHRERA